MTRLRAVVVFVAAAAAALGSHAKGQSDPFPRVEAAIAKGRDAIEGSQSPGTGAWSDGPRSTVDTLAAVRSLSALADAGVPADAQKIVSGARFLSGADGATPQRAASRLIGLVLSSANASEARRLIMDAQNQDGGWGLVPGKASNAVDTTAMIDALFTGPGLALEPAVLIRSRDYLIGTQSAQFGRNGAWLVADDPAVSDTARTAMAVIALCRLREIVGDPALDLAVLRGVQFIETQSPTSISEKALVLAARAVSGQRQPAALAAALTQLLDAQHPDTGLWENGVHATGSALLALVAVRSAATNALPDLEFAAADAVTLPADPQAGQRLTVQVRVRNAGGAPVADARVALYDRHPGTGAPPVAVALSGPLQPSQERAVPVLWPTTGPTGERRLWVVLDDRDALREADETDNTATTTVTLAAGTVDLVVDPSGLWADIDYELVEPDGNLIDSPYYSPRARCYAAVRNAGGDAIPNQFSDFAVMFELFRFRDASFPATFSMIIWNSGIAGGATLVADSHAPGAEGSGNVHQQWTPNGFRLPPGTYFLRVTADHFSNINDPDRSNNVAWKEIVVPPRGDGPDLSVTGLLVPDGPDPGTDPDQSGPAGHRVRLSVNGFARGAGAGPFLLRLAAVNPRAPLGTPLLDDVPVQPTGPDGAWSTTVEAVLPEGVSKIWALIDARDAVAEQNETNNLRELAFTATPTAASPDAAIASGSPIVSHTDISGRPVVTLSATVLSAGGVAVPTGAKLRFVRVVRGAGAPVETAIGDPVTLGAIPAGGSAVGSVLWLPRPGRAEVKAVVDLPVGTTEPTPHNNSRSVVVEFLAARLSVAVDALPRPGASAPPAAPYQANDQVLITVTPVELPDGDFYAIEVTDPAGGSAGAERRALGAPGEFLYNVRLRPPGDYVARVERRRRVSGGSSSVVLEGAYRTFRVLATRRLESVSPYLTPDLVRSQLPQQVRLAAQVSNQSNVPLQVFFSTVIKREGSATAVPLPQTFGRGTFTIPAGAAFHTVDLGTWSYPGLSPAGPYTVTVTASPVGALSKTGATTLQVEPRRLIRMVKTVQTIPPTAPPTPPHVPPRDGQRARVTITLTREE